MYTVINIYPALMCKKNNTKINAKQKVKNQGKMLWHNESWIVRKVNNYLNETYTHSREWKV